MNSRHVFASIMLVLSLMQLAAATTTVTLTGSCPASIINQSSNYLVFNITNSGNGAATNFNMVPIIEGATTSNSTATIPFVAPGSNYTTKFYLYNFSEPGSYVDYIRASYLQGSSTYVTVFPCLVSIIKRSQSLLQITNVSRVGSKLSVDIINLASYPISTNVVMQASATFNITPKSIPLQIDPNGRSTATFSISLPNYTSASFPAVASVSYSNSGIHYATLGSALITFAGSSTSSGPSIATIGIIVIIIILIVLILVSFMRKKPKKPKVQQPAVAEAPKPDATQAMQ